MPGAVPPTLKPARNALTGRGTVQTIHAADVKTGGDGETYAMARNPVTKTPDTAPTEHLRRRRGRPPKIRQPGKPDFVEWWKPGWRERLR